MAYERSDMLLHSGKKGMKWGVRRYQNKDGTLTDAGRKRYDRDQRENSGKKKGNKVGAADPNRWVKEDLDRSKHLVDASSQLNNNIKQIQKESARSIQKPKMNLSKMTDAEMREQINRAYLERQYTDLFSPQAISKGRAHVDKVLEAAGSTLAVTSSALGIALAIKELKG